MSEFPAWTEKPRPPWVGGLLLALGGMVTLLALTKVGVQQFAPARAKGVAFEYLPTWMLGSVGAAFVLGGVAEFGRWGRPWLRTPLKWEAWAVGAILLGYSAYMALGLNFLHPTDESESYVYVQTFNDINEITGPLYDLAKENPNNYHLRGIILCDSTYPLPWLLGDFTHINYYSGSNKPPDFHGDFLMVSEKRTAEAEAGLDTDYFKQTLRLRAALEPQTLYMRASMFQHLMPERSPEFHPAKTATEPGPAAEKLQNPEAEDRNSKETINNRQ